VRDLIESRCGLRFDDTQRASLSASVAARMEELGLTREDEYLSRLRGAAPTLVERELRNLLNLVTVTETCFFRDASQFRLLREHILPTLMAERRHRGIPVKIRIWSAGSSTGEEAYSIAITLDQMGLLRKSADCAFEIIGTDLNTKALEKAREGVYTRRAVRNVEGRLLDEYFVRNGDTFALRDAMKSHVTFQFGNLTQTPMPTTGSQDVVFCKNVAIYFRAAATRKLIAGLRDTLAPGGYLLLGHAESLWQLSDGFSLVEYERAFCYRKEVVSGFIRTVDSDVRLKADTTYVPEVRVTADKTYAAAAHYDFCLGAFRAGDWGTAESALTELVGACPTFVPGLLLLGGLYVHCGRLDDAVAQGEAILDVSDLEARAHLLLGMIAARRQRHDDAQQSLRRALYLDDSLALAHFWLGNLYRDRGDLARACHEYENLVRDWEQHTMQLTEEFASDLTAEQLVGFCRDMLMRLRRAAANG
jgi:chemotaxis protein methyltransferase CheR